MIPVYVRHENQEDSQKLGDFPPQEIDKLVPLFSRYPTYDQREGAEEHTVVLAQFVVDDAGSFFEIVVGKPDDTTG